MTKLVLKAVKQGLWRVQIRVGKALLVAVLVNEKELKQFREELSWAYELQEGLKVAAKKEKEEVTDGTSKAAD